MPTLAYFLATTSDPIDGNHPLWDCPLPNRRRGTPTTGDGLLVDERLSYGDYFSAVARFCSESGWKRLLLAATKMLARPLTVDAIEDVSIFLQKHGAFYHPARVEVTAAGQRLALVVNVAASRIGKQALARETRALAHLNEFRPFGWFPSVFAVADTNPPMFLGNWFDGFHEFHFTRKNSAGDLGIVVWDGALAPRLLSKTQAAALYKNMAMILAASYDPVTTCQIFPWHHAAGDFVVRPEGDTASVKLITARNYAPLSDSPFGPADENELLESLLVFFLHLSIRMRLDRLDGVAAVVWAPDRCLGPIIEGFFQGLDLTARLSGFPENFPRFFHRYINHQHAGDLIQLASQLVNAVFDGHREERQAAENHLEAHIAETVKRLAV